MRRSQWTRIPASSQKVVPEEVAARSTLAQRQYQETPEHSKAQHPGQSSPSQQEARDSQLRPLFEFFSRVALGFDLLDFQRKILALSRLNHAEFVMADPNKCARIEGLRRRLEMTVDSEVVTFQQIQTHPASGDLNLGVIECDRQFRNIYRAAGVPANGQQIAFVYIFLPGFKRPSAFE